MRSLPGAPDREIQPVYLGYIVAMQCDSANISARSEKKGCLCLICRLGSAML